MHFESNKARGVRNEKSFREKLKFSLEMPHDGTTARSAAFFSRRRWLRSRRAVLPRAP
jgi:hypothetical protein